VNSVTPVVNSGTAINPSGQNISLGNSGTVINPSGQNISLGNSGTVINPSGQNIPVVNSGTVINPSGQNISLGNSGAAINPSGQNISLRNSGTVINPSGENIDPSKITWEGTEYNISQTKEEWKENDTNNFLNFLGIPKKVFSSDEQEYSDFITGIRTCLDDSSSIDTTCDAVNNILRRVIELRIQELVEQKRYGNVQKVMNVISHKEDGSNPVAEPVKEAETPEESS
jgi:hypothetical protein